MCESAEESTNHLFIHCEVASSISSHLFQQCGIACCVPGSLAELAESWRRAPFVGYGRTLWRIAPFFLFCGNNNIFKEVSSSTSYLGGFS